MPRKGSAARLSLFAYHCAELSCLNFVTISHRLAIEPKQKQTTCWRDCLCGWRCLGRRCLCWSFWRRRRPFAEGCDAGGWALRNTTEHPRRGRNQKLHRPRPAPHSEILKHTTGKLQSCLEACRNLARRYQHLQRHEGPKRHSIQDWLLVGLGRPCFPSPQPKSLLKEAGRSPRALLRQLAAGFLQPSASQRHPPKLQQAHGLHRHHMAKQRKCILQVSIFQCCTPSLFHKLHDHVVLLHLRASGTCRKNTCLDNPLKLVTTIERGTTCQLLA